MATAHRQQNDRNGETLIDIAVTVNFGDGKDWSPEQWAAWYALDNAAHDLLNAFQRRVELALGGIG